MNTSISKTTTWNNLFSLALVAIFLLSSASSLVAAGETWTVRVYAKKEYNFTNIPLEKGAKYRFETNGVWYNVNRKSNGDGYPQTPAIDQPRKAHFNMMELLGETFTRNNDITSYNTSAGTFHIGKGGYEKTARRDGFLMCFANDNPLFYKDNRGYITLTVTKIEDAPEDWAVGESKTVRIQANRRYNYTHIMLDADHTYRFHATGSWYNVNRRTDADGYPQTPVIDQPRQSDYNMMELVGEIFSRNHPTAYTNRHFGIGQNRTYSPPRDGFLVCHANDNALFYSDNRGTVTLRITRTR